jgi:hypothetical protein
MTICGKQAKKYVPYLTVQNIAYTKKTTRSQHLRNCLVAADLKASASAATTTAAGTAGCVDVVGPYRDVSFATSVAARLWTR